MPRSPHIASSTADAHSSSPSPTDCLYAERIMTPTFPRSLRPPPPLRSPLGETTRSSEQAEGNANANAHYRTNTGSSSGRNNGVFPASSRASQSTSVADAVYASLNHSFSHPPLGVTLDEEQRRCVNTAFHISFHGNPRVKHKPTCVDLPNGVLFLIVDRFVSGNSVGVYEKNKKIWEQIPLGQARVFARAPPALKTNSGETTDRAVGNAGAGAGGGAGNPSGMTMETELDEEAAATTTATTQKFSPVSNSSYVFQQLSRSPTVAASPAPIMQTFTINNNNTLHTNSEWTCVAAAVGLRKMGHWRDATTLYTLQKEVAKSAIALEKVDGESGQLSAFTWMGERYWLVGCRYQHIVTRLEVPEADLVRYAVVTSASASTISSPSSDVPTEEALFVSSPVQSFTAQIRDDAGDLKNNNTDNNTNCSSSAPHDHEQRSTHSSCVTGATAVTGGGLTSEAGYLELAVRMARLWRRVLESLPATMEKNPHEEDEKNDSRGSEESLVAALHACIEADKRTLCFDAILTGWERLQGFTALHRFSSDASSSGTATPASSSDSPHTTQLPSSSAVLASSSSLTTSRWEAEIPLWFYAITWDVPLDVQGWCMPVRRAHHFFTEFHLPFVPVSAAVELGSPEYEVMRQSVLSRCDTAGAVLYGSSKSIDNDDCNTNGNDDGTVVQVWKCRAYPHTLERVVQEYVVTHRLCGDPLRNKVKRKVSSLSRETRLCVKQWEVYRLPFLLDFALWLHREKYITPSTDLAALKSIRGHWLSYQDRFKDVLLAQLQRQQQRLSARPSSMSTLDVSRKEERLDEDDADDEAASEMEDSVDSIMLVGPQGCGKSTMARVLYSLLEEAGAAPRWLNQDEVGTRTAYLTAIRRAITRGTYSHVLLDKMNLDDKARADYSEIGVKPVLVVAWTHASGTEAMVNTCYERVVQRGACHRTFHAEASKSGQNLSFSMSSRSPELRPAATPLMDVAFPLSESSPSPSPEQSLSTECVPRVPSFSRLHNILEASAKRYQAPSNMPCVELDVTWDCRRAVSVVWEALRDKGSCELPPLSELNVTAALQTAQTYERLLEAYPSRVAAAVLRGPSGESILSQLGSGRPPTLHKAQRLQPQVEVILHDFQLNPSPTALVRYASQIDTTRRLIIQAVVSNSKVVLLLVLGPSESIAAAAASFAKETSGAVTTTRGGGDGMRRTMSASTLGTGDAATVAPAVSQDLEDYLESQTHQEQWAVVAKAKKVTVEYCETLAQRVRDDPQGDPYCAVRWLSPPLTMDFTVAFTFP